MRSSVTKGDRTIDLSVLAWNIHGLSDKLGCPDFRKKLLGYDIIFLCETWLFEDSDKSLYKIQGYQPENFPRFKFSSGQKSSGGIIFYVKNSVRKYVTVIKNVCDHFLVVKISNEPMPQYIIFAYIPPYDTPYKCIHCDNNFYEMLYDLYITFSAIGSVKVCGDLNSRTANTSDCPEIYAYNELLEDDQTLSALDVRDSDMALPQRCSQDAIVNTQGKFLLEFCKSTGLRIVNGRASHDKHIGKFTFHRLLKKGDTKMARSTIDYLLAPSQCFQDIIHFNVDDKMPESDHCSISFMFKICITPVVECHDNNVYNVCSKYKWDGTKTTDLVHNLFDQKGLDHLEHFLDSVRHLLPSDHVAKAFHDYIDQAADRCLRKGTGQNKKSPIPHNDWYDTECKNARKILQLANDEKADSHTISHLERDYKRIRQKKKRHSKLGKSSEIMLTDNPTEMWTKLKSWGSKNTDDVPLSLKDFYTHFSKPAVENRENIHNFDLSLILRKKL